MRWICWLAISACGSTTTMDGKEPGGSAAQREATVEAAAPQLAEPRPPAASASPRCEPGPPALSSYDAIEKGLEFTLVLKQDERGVWSPARPLEMPYHHASGIEWTGDGLLETFQGREARVVAVGIGRTKLEHDPARGVWFATYAAQIVSVCSP